MELSKSKKSPGIFEDISGPDKVQKMKKKFVIQRLRLVKMTS